MGFQGPGSFPAKLPCLKVSLPQFMLFKVITVIHFSPCTADISGTLWNPKKMVGNLLQQHTGRQKGDLQHSAQLRKHGKE